MIPLFVLLGLIAVVVIWVIGIYNALVGLRNRRHADAVPCRDRGKILAVPDNVYHRSG